jgi:ABC-2 type transport system permease protein
VFDASRTQQSRALVQQFTATDNFVLRGYAGSYEEAERQVDAGRARAAIVIPGGYARDLKRGRATSVQVLVDASDPTAAQAAIGAAQMVGQRQSLEILRQRTPGASDIGALPIDVRVRPLYNPALASALFIVPGIIGMILSNMLIMMTALSLVREREHGTMEQLIVTPLVSAAFVGARSPEQIQHAVRALPTTPETLLFPQADLERLAEMEL